MKDQENRIRKIIKNHEKEFGLNPFAETTTNHIIDICCKVINKESSPPPEEQKVKDGFEKDLLELLEYLRNDMFNEKSKKRSFAISHSITQVELILSEYLKHTPKQKYGELENILNKFIGEIKAEFPSQNWDYLDFIKERVLPKAPEKEGGENG